MKWLFASEHMSIEGLATSSGPWLGYSSLNIHVPVEEREKYDRQLCMEELLCVMVYSLYTGL